MSAKSFKLGSDGKALTSRLVNPQKRQLWKEIIACPQYQTNFLRLGHWLTRDGQFEEAVIFYRYAVRKHPHSYRLLLKLALAYENAGEEVAAIRTYRRLIRRFPDRFQAYIRLEKIYRRSLNYEEAIALYLSIPAANPVKELSFRRLFHIYAVEGDLDRAVKILQEAIKNYGESYDRCLELGKLDLRRSNFLGAVQSFESAVAFRPRSIETRTWLGIALKELGNLRLAEYEFNEILKIKPDSYQGLIHLAELNIQEKKFDEALSCLEAIERKTPGNARVTICRGWIALKQGAPEKAVEHCLSGLKESSFYFVWEQVLAYRIMSRARQELNDHPGADLHRLLATAMSGKDTYESLIRLAEQLLKKKELAAATEVFLRVMELFTRNTRAQVGLGEIYLKQGETDNAILICRRALENIRPIYIRERIRAHTVISLSYKSQKKIANHKKEDKIIHGLLRQMYLKPSEKSQIKKEISVGK
ncbi:MAG: tetratricopeptide repeat protein [PVC group bacterium]